jgi:hypothetical protein
MANKRVFYAIQRIGVSPITGSTPVDFTTLRGIQSVGITTNFSLEQVFELGQLEVYENIEGIPDVQVNVEKVLDGWCPVYLMATQADGDGVATPNATLVGRSNGRCIMGLTIYPDTNDTAEGDPGVEVDMSGLYLSNVRYQVNTNGNATESVGLVGNNKVWVLGGATGDFVGHYVGSGTWDSPWASGDVDPLAIDGSGGVNRREDVIFGSGADASFLPANLPGVTVVSGTGYNILANGQYGSHIQSISISTDLGREQLFELGRRGDYCRYMNFPVVVTTEISVITGSGDLISATEEGIFDDGTGGACGTRYNLTDNAIKLCLCEGLIVDCGAKNKLRSTSQTGGDTGRGNVEITYTYENQNTMKVQHPQDPVVALRP